jgi:basic membrane protein A
MKHLKMWRLVSLLLIVVLVLAACSDAADEEPTAAPAVEEPAEEPVEEPAEEVAEEPVEEPAEEMADAPTDLKIAIITCCGIESMWDASFFEAMERVKADSPHDLNITWDWTDGVWGDDAELVMREYAETGEYDIIWATSSYSDQAKNLKDEYPDTMFIYHGSGNEALGDNAYWLYMRVHEPAYVLGTLAGTLTENDKVGVVGTFAFDDVNDEINAFFEGAKAVNPDVSQTVSFIESWYDPVAGNEATNAQAAAGVDFMLQLGDGWEACVDTGINCFGNFGDQNFLAPDNVPSSTKAMWDPGILWLIDEWYTYATEGTWNGNPDKIWFPMAEGGSDLAEISDLGGKIPQDAIDAAMQMRQDIIDGKVEVTLNVEVPESD